MAKYFFVCLNAVNEENKNLNGKQNKKKIWNKNLLNKMEIFSFMILLGFKFDTLLI